MRSVDEHRRVVAGLITARPAQTVPIADALGMGLGFCLALLLLGVVREVLGSGSLFGADLFGPGFERWVILVLPSGGFLTFAGWLLLFNRMRRKRAAGGAR